MPIPPLLPRWVVATASALCVAALSSDAVACTFAPRAGEGAYPAWSSENVPTNVVLFAAPLGLDPEGFRLRASDGTEVAMTASAAGDSGWDLAPDQELAPATRYDLQYFGDMGTESTTHFTTGAGPAQPVAELSVPDDVRYLAVTRVAGTCGTLGSLCARSALPEGTSLEILSGKEMLQPTFGGDYVRRYSRPIDAQACLTVRARDALGNRSEPVEVCGVGSRDLGESDLTCEDPAIFGSGCGVAPRGGQGVPWASFALLGALAMAGAARRGRSRS